MPEAKFILKEPKSDKETLVYLFYNFNYQRLKYSTAEKILPKYWNEEKQRAKETKAFPEYSEFNSRLKYLETTVNNIYRRLQNDGLTITPELLRTEINIALGKEKKKENVSLMSFIQLYINEAANFKKINTLKAYTSTYRHLQNFAAKQKRKYDFQDIDLTFYNDFMTYCLKDLNLSNNTIGKYVKTLKVFLNEATERGINTNLEYKKKKFKLLNEQTEKIYLSKSEIEKIYNLDLKSKPGLERVRDLFVIGCYTGLRFSDYGQIKKENILEGNKLKIKTIKTDDTVIIPIHPIVKSILEKYQMQLPKIISSQKVNEYLKEIAQLAGIEETVETNITKGGKRITSYCKKYELVSTHAARRSFATNMYLAGIPSIHIMKITGHKSESVFLKYIRISQEENANNLLNHPFFA